MYLQFYFVVCGGLSRVDGFCCDIKRKKMGARTKSRLDLWLRVIKKIHTFVESF
jgi:hypothetical protein